MGGLSRRFLNLIVGSSVPGAKSLRCIDLTRHNFFNTTPPSLNGSEISKGPAAADALNQKNKEGADDVALNMDTIQLPEPIINLKSSRSDLKDQWKMDCFPLVDRMVICADHGGRTFLFDGKRQLVLTLPRLHEPKEMPISLFIPCPDDADVLDGGCGGSLFIMERNPKAAALSSKQFEAFVYRNPHRMPYMKCWISQLVPPPPYVYDIAYLKRCPEIRSYAALGDGSTICISVHGVGTYCLNTRSFTWSQLGKWMLPFYGKVDYVPELKLWIGLSANAQDMAAADLSSTDSEPQLLGTLKEFDPPKKWREIEDSQIVNLGSGKFCIARFFHTSTRNKESNELIEKNITVLTGVEVVQCVHDGNESGRKMLVQLIPHKSKCYTSNGSDTIQRVF